MADTVALFRCECGADITNSRRRTLHDLICGTWVLEDRAWS